MILNKKNRLKRRLRRHKKLNKLFKLNTQQMFCQHWLKEDSLTIKLILLSYWLLYRPWHGLSSWWGQGKGTCGGGSSPTKLIWKPTHAQRKKNRKRYNGFRWDRDSDNGQNESVWVACLLFTRQFHNQTYWKSSSTLESPQRMDTLGELFVVRRSPMTKR